MTAVRSFFSFCFHHGSCVIFPVYFQYILKKKKVCNWVASFSLIRGHWFYFVRFVLNLRHFPHILLILNEILYWNGTDIVLRTNKWHFNALDIIFVIIFETCPIPTESHTFLCFILRSMRIQNTFTAFQWTNMVRHVCERKGPRKKVEIIKCRNSIGFCFVESNRNSLNSALLFGILLKHITLN